MDMSSRPFGAAENGVWARSGVVELSWRPTAMGGWQAGDSSHSFDMPEPWGAFTDENMRVSFEAQLRREVGPGHLLDGIDVHAIARRYDRDDVLFALDRGGWAIVHLAWGETSHDPRWPTTSLFATKDDVDARIAADASEFG
jgi:hypothetical protein